ncbi:MAG: cyclic pyranopterin monophosphate synthase MoaC [Lachnospiraceae bacterium]
MEFNHFDDNGNAIMVDVSEKKDTDRIALAKGRIYMSEETIRAVKGGSVKKGDVLGVARVAGIMAAKKTPDLIPLCHVLCLTKAAVDFKVEDTYVEAECTVRTTGKTGVEMEALTGVSVALLTIFDMCKALDKTMEITDVHVVRKEGGKSGLFENPKDKAGN